MSIFNDCSTCCSSSTNDDCECCSPCFIYRYDNTENIGGTDPGSGFINFNDNLTTATQMYISDIDQDGNNIENFLATIGDSTSTIKGHVKISKEDNSNVFVIFDIIGTSVDLTTYWSLPISYLSGDSTLTNRIKVCICFDRTGDKGDQGEAGENTCWIISDIKAAGTDGGTFLPGVWRTRTLNTIVSHGTSTGDITIAANQMTINPGSYCVIGQAPASNVQLHKARIRNITDGVTTIVGSTARSTSNNSPAFIIGIITVPVGPAKVFEVQHRGTVPKVTDGFGEADGFDEVEVYTQLKITRI